MALAFVAFLVLINLIWSALILYHLSKFGVGLEARLLSIIFIIGLFVLTLMVFSVEGQINFESLMSQLPPI